MANQKRVGIMRWIKGVMLRKMHSMITCREFEGFVNDYLDGTLPIEQRKLFDLHLKLCRECRDYLAAYKRTIEISGAVLGPANDSVPDTVPEDLIKAVLQSRGK